jgi:hypothetical protein
MRLMPFWFRFGFNAAQWVGSSIPRGGSIEISKKIPEAARNNVTLLGNLELSERTTCGPVHHETHDANDESQA